MKFHLGEQAAGDTLRARGAFKAHEHGDVIPPFVVLRRQDRFEVAVISIDWLVLLTNRVLVSMAFRRRLKGAKELRPGSEKMILQPNGQAPVLSEQ
jgi:hypothetical protein